MEFSTNVNQTKSAGYKSYTSCSMAIYPSVTEKAGQQVSPPICKALLLST